MANGRPNPSMASAPAEQKAGGWFENIWLLNGIIIGCAVGMIAVISSSFFEPLDLNSKWAILKGPVAFFALFVALTAALWWRGEAKKPSRKRGQLGLGEWMWENQIWRSWTAPFVGITVVLWVLTPYTMPSLVTATRGYVALIFVLSALAFSRIGNPDDTWLKRWGNLVFVVGFILTLVVLGSRFHLASTGQETWANQAVNNQPAQSPTRGHVPAQIPAGAVPISPGEQIQQRHSRYGINTNARKGYCWVHIAPNDPKTVGVRVPVDAKFIFDRKSGLFDTSSWSGFIYVERGGVQYKVSVNSPKLISFGLWDVGEDRLFRRPTDGLAVCTAVSRHDVLDMNQLLGDLRNYPGENRLQPRFAINLDHPLLKGGKILGGQVQIEFLVHQMGRTDYL